MKTDGKTYRLAAAFLRKLPLRVVFMLFLLLGTYTSHGFNTDSLSDTTNISTLLRDSLLSPAERMILVKKIAELYQNSNPQKALEYNNLTAVMARVRSDTQMLAHAFFHMAENYQALSLYDKADSIFMIINNRYKPCNLERQANLFCKIADNFYSWSRYKKSAEYYVKARRLFDKMGIKSGIAATLKGEGKVWSNYNDYARSIGLFQRAYNIYQQLNDQNGLAAIDNELGKVMESWGKLESANNFFTSAYRIYQKKGDLFNEANMLLHLGEIQQKQKKYSKALNYYQKAKKLSQKINSNILYVISLSNIAEIYYLENQYDLAVNYQQIALPLKKKIGDRRRIAISMLDLGKIYYKKTKIDTAFLYGDSALFFAKTIRAKDLLLGSYLLLSEVSKQKNDFAKAYAFLKHYNKIYQEIFTDKNRQMVSEIEVRFEAEKNEKENELLRKQDKLNHVKLSEEKDIRFLLIIFISFFVVVAMIVLVFIQYKNKIINTNFGLLAARNQKITEQTGRLTKLNNELFTSREQYRSIVENATIGMYQTTPDGRILFANKTLLHMLGYSFSELEKINLNNAKANRQHFVEMIEKQGIITGREDVWEHADGSKIYVKESAWIIRDKNDNVLYYEGIIEDITKRKHAEDVAETRKKRLQKINAELHKRNIEIRLAKNQAEEANRAKSLFIANISHEIRTPLNSIIGFTDLLLPMAKTPKEKTFLQSIKNSSNNLLSLINDILDLSKIQAEKLELYTEPVSIHSIVEGIQQIFYPQIEKKQLRFISRISSTLDGMFMLDTVRFRQILFNLVGNAIKFTDIGFVKLTVSGQSSADNEKHYDLKITIEDTGSGIPEVEQEIIFEAFRQSTDSPSQQRQGTGLGLSITKRLVEAMNGTISLKSELNKGTMFTIKLRGVEKVGKVAGYDTKAISKKSELQYSQEAKPLPVKIDAEIRREFFNKFFHKWEVINYNKVIDDITAFGKEVFAFGKEKQVRIIQKTGKQLVEASGSFEIETMERLLLQIKSFF